MKSNEIGSTTSANMLRFWVTPVFALLIGIGLYVYLFFSYSGTLPSFPENVVSYLVAGSIALLSTYMSIAVSRWLDKLIPWRQHFLLRYATAVAAALALTVGVVVAATALFHVSSSLQGSDLLNEYAEELVKLTILLLLVYMVFQAVYFSFYSYRQYAFVQISRIAEERKHLKLQFEALKSQLSPHYLFNSLNTISSLIYKDKAAAEEFIRRLAVTFQYVIATNKERLVSLNEEVEFVRSYYHLLRVRFEDSINLEINLPEDLLETSIPPLTLQILIENAVKHNRFDLDHPLQIQVETTGNGSLKVFNNRLEPAESSKSFKVGLENIKKRYAFYTESKIRIDDQNASFFSVELPLLKATGSASA